MQPQWNLRNNNDNIVNNFYYIVNMSNSYLLSMDASAFYKWLHYYASHTSANVPHLQIPKDHSQSALSHCPFLLKKKTNIP